MLATPHHVLVGMIVCSCDCNHCTFHYVCMLTSGVEPPSTNPDVSCSVTATVRAAGGLDIIWNAIVHDLGIFREDKRPRPLFAKPAAPLYAPRTPRPASSTQHTPAKPVTSSSPATTAGGSHLCRCQDRALPLLAEP